MLTWFRWATLMTALCAAFFYGYRTAPWSYVDATVTAYWVQAIGSVAAIFFSGWYATRQAKRQFIDASKLQQIAATNSELKMAEALEMIALLASKRMLHLIREIGWNREIFTNYCTGATHFDKNLLNQIQYDLDAIQLHDLPNSKIIYEIATLRSITRQVKENVTKAFNDYRIMTGQNFASFFNMLDDAHKQMCVSLISLEIETINIRNRL
ncbi:hypothetical protein [Janthinobacterium sp. HLS12-2]|uniref:hypothetical protein n=1 Tax=Janthinobacterium sp. HLS12-2 TaxID=1259324 RepID=UPI003F22DD11